MLNKTAFIGATIFYVAYWLYILIASFYGFGSAWGANSKGIFLKCVIGLLKIFSHFPSSSIILNSFAWTIIFYFIFITVIKVKASR